MILRKKRTNMKVSFLANTSISATGYNMKIGENTDNKTNLSNFKFEKKLDNKKKYTAVIII